MKKLGVLLLPHWMGADGSGIYFLRFARKLKENGHRVIVCSSGGLLVKELEKSNIKHHRFVTLRGTLLPLHRYLIPKLDSSRVKNPLLVLLLDYMLRWNILFLFEFANMLRIVNRERIDVIHSHGSSSDLFAFMCSKTMNIPWLTLASTVYSSLPFNLAALKSSVGKVIAISEECKNCLNPQFDETLERKTMIIPNSIDIKKFSPPQSSDEIMRYEKELNIIPGKKKIVLLSRLISAKKDPIIGTIKAALIIHKEIQDFQIIIAGTGELIDEVNKLANETNEKIGQRLVLVKGFVREVEKLMKVADIIIAIGQSATEAMACGKPVIVAGHRVGPKGGSFGGIITEETIGEIERCYFTGRNSCVRTDSTLIAEACIELLKDEKKMKLFGNYNRRFAESHFNIDQRMIEIQEIYLDLIKNG